VNSSRAASLFLLLLVATLTSLRAQTGAIQPGDRVRVRAAALGGGGRVEGTVVTVSDSALTLMRESSGGSLQIPLAGVQSLDVRRGQRSAWKEGAEIGAFVGFVTASSVYAARMSRCVGLECAKATLWVAHGAAGSVAGAVLGGLVGTTIRRDVWSRVPITRVQPLLTPTVAGVRAGIEIQF